MIQILSSVSEMKGRIFFIGVGGGAGNATHAVNDFRRLLTLSLILQLIMFQNLQQELMMMVGSLLYKVVTS